MLNENFSRLTTLLEFDQTSRRRREATRAVELSEVRLEINMEPFGAAFSCLVDSLTHERRADAAMSE